jgi:hypothetical protein
MKEQKEMVKISKITLEELYEKSRGIESKCVDYSVGNVKESVRFSLVNGAVMFKTDSGVHEKQMSRFAFSQFCAKLGVPVRYLEKCVDNGMIDLAEDNLNSWVGSYDKDLFLREYDDSLRGVLSDRYAVLDTPAILKTVMESVKDYDLGVKGYFLSPERFHARLVQKEMMNIEGEDLFAGIQIDSSDVGRRTLGVRFIIFKQVCTNGLCLPKEQGILFRQKHIGIESQEFENQLSASLQAIPTLIEQAENKIEMCRNTEIPNNMFDEDSSLRTQFKNGTGFSDKNIVQIQELISEKYGATQWGLINAMTEIAKEHTLERRLEIESLAGNYMPV